VSYPVICISKDHQSKHNHPLYFNQHLLQQRLNGPDLGIWLHHRLQSTWTPAPITIHQYLTVKGRW